jgi:hypothetical protein
LWGGGLSVNPPPEFLHSGGSGGDKVMGIRVNLEVFHQFGIGSASFGAEDLESGEHVSALHKAITMAGCWDTAVAFRSWAWPTPSVSFSSRHFLFAMIHFDLPAVEESLGALPAPSVLPEHHDGAEEHDCVVCEIAELFEDDPEGGGKKRRPGLYRSSR